MAVKLNRQAFEHAAAHLHGLIDAAKSSKGGNPRL
jgi:hypothetical protein